MLDQREAIINGDWDHLLVLDACRFDHFKKIYGNHISGNLKKAESPVSCKNGIATSEWCKRVFTEKYDDTVYVSSTPHVNSQMEVYGFNGPEHFHEIIDVWDWGWNEEKGTVLPEKINEALLESEKRFEDKRIISHYMQPHFPYLTLQSPSNPKTKKPGARNSIKTSIKTFFGSRIRTSLGGEKTRKLMDALKLPPMNPMHEVLRKSGAKKLKEAYMENLRIVLKSVAEVSEKLTGEIVITSDHGEYLGEDGFYGHSYLPDHPVLNTVPWLKVEE